MSEFQSARRASHHLNWKGNCHAFPFDSLNSWG